MPRSEGDGIDDLGVRGAGGQSDRRHVYRAHHDHDASDRTGAVWEEDDRA